MSGNKASSKDSGKGKAGVESLKKLVELGDSNLKKGDKLEARHYYQEAMVKYPHDADGFLKMADVSFAANAMDEANDFYNQALDIDPRCTAAWLGSAKTYLKLNSTSRAEEAINRAVQLDAENPEVKLFAGLIKIQVHNLGLALQFLQPLAQKKDGLFYGEANFLIGQIYAQQSWFTKALDAFNICKGLPAFSSKDAPNYLSLHNNIALVQFRLGNNAEAEKILVDPTKSFPKADASLWINLAQVYWVQDKINETFQAFDQANALKPGAWPWMDELKSYKEKGAEWLKASIEKLKKEQANGINVGIYLGCIIPNRYPYIEAATRHVLDALNVGVLDLKGAGCCPAPGVFRSFDIETWLTLGARNIVISEELKRDLVTMCNGCYGTLNDINDCLQEDEAKKETVNAHLKKIKKEYKGTIKVKHIMEVLYNDIGLEKLQKLITNKLNLKLAVHYGCHIIKPSVNKPWKESPEGPEFFDKMVEITGAKSIPYQDKMMCCGAGGGVRGAMKEVALDFTKDKLMAMREAGIDAIVLCCPFCAMQFDIGQTEVNALFKDQIGEPFRFPVIYITQLLGWAMGMDPYRLGLLKAPKAKGVPPFNPFETLFTTYNRFSW